MTSEASSFAPVRRPHGSTITEFGPTLLIAFAIIVFPLLAFGTLGLRYIFLLNATRLAAQSASRCQTFKTNISPTNLSSVTTALNVSKNSISGLGGNTVSWVSTNTYIYVCPLGSTTVTTPGANTPLPAPADPVNNSYNCVVNISATLAPIFPGFHSMLGNIPGLNSPINATAQTAEFFENTSNLNQ